MSISVFSQIRKIDNKYYKDNDLYNGIYTESYDNGNLKIKLNIKNGLENGLCYNYYENGNIKEQFSYKDGMFNGEFKEWDKDGNVLAIAYYINNKKEGSWLIYKDNVLRYKINYSNDFKKGESYMYDENGELLSMKVY
jgi:antitoxin component YwqK of YwqJK toxin-antitoxin module